MAVAKPAMRGLLSGSLKRDFLIATGLSFVCSAVWHFTVKAPRKARYDAFYKTYDADADFQRMKAAGIFQSVTPDGSVGEGW